MQSLRMEQINDATKREGLLSQHKCVLFKLENSAWALSTQLNFGRKYKFIIFQKQNWTSLSKEICNIGHILREKHIFKDCGSHLIKELN